MTTVAEFITYLQTLPPEITVEVLAKQSSGQRYLCYTHWIDLELPTKDSPKCSESMEYFSSSDIGFLRLGTD